MVSCRLPNVYILCHIEMDVTYLRWSMVLRSVAEAFCMLSHSIYLMASDHLLESHMHHWSPSLYKWLSTHFYFHFEVNYCAEPGKHVIFPSCWGLNTVWGTSNIAAYRGPYLIIHSKPTGPLDSRNAPTNFNKEIYLLWELPSIFHQNWWRCRSSYRNISLSKEVSFRSIGSGCTLVHEREQFIGQLYYY